MVLSLFLISIGHGVVGVLVMQTLEFDQQRTIAVLFDFTTFSRGQLT